MVVTDQWGTGILSFALSLSLPLAALNDYYFAFRGGKDDEEYGINE